MKILKLSARKKNINTKKNSDNPLRSIDAKKILFSLHTLELGLSASAADSCCIFTLAVRQRPVSASCIEIYYFQSELSHFVTKNSKKLFVLNNISSQFLLKDPSLW